MKQFLELITSMLLVSVNGGQLSTFLVYDFQPTLTLYDVTVVQIASFSAYIIAKVCKRLAGILNLQIVIFSTV